MSKLRIHYPLFELDDGTKIVAIPKEQPDIPQDKYSFEINLPEISDKFNDWIARLRYEYEHAN